MSTDSGPEYLEPVRLDDEPGPADAPTPATTAKSRPRWVIPAAAALAGAVLAGGISAAVAENTISKWSAKVNAVTAERDDFAGQLAGVTDERDAALKTIEYVESTEGQRDTQIRQRVTAVEKREAAADERETELDERSEELDDQEVDLKAREKAVGIAEKKEEAKSIYEGVWMVGDDIKPGTYKLREAYTGDMCYWGISQNGRIVDNDIVTGGRPTVTLRKGQEFKNQGCGVWRRL